MAKKLLPDLERVLRKTAIDAVSGCWLWTDRLDKDGYGVQVKIGSYTDGSRRGVRPHRFVYEAMFRKIPVGLVIDHLCRVRNCLNPFHMEAVPPQVNHERGLRARRRFCRRGHEISGSNEIIRGDVKGHRCRICLNEYQRNYQKTNGHRYSKAYRERKNRNR